MLVLVVASKKNNGGWMDGDQIWDSIIDRSNWGNEVSESDQHFTFFVAPPSLLLSLSLTVSLRLLLIVICRDCLLLWLITGLAFRCGQVVSPGQRSQFGDIFDEGGRFLAIYKLNHS